MPSLPRTVHPRTIFLDHKVYRVVITFFLRSWLLVFFLQNHLSWTLFGHFSQPVSGLSSLLILLPSINSRHVLLEMSNFLLPFFSRWTNFLAKVPLFNYIYQLSQLSAQFILDSHIHKHRAFIALNYSNSLKTTHNSSSSTSRAFTINLTSVLFPPCIARGSKNPRNPLCEDFSHPSTHSHTP